MAGVTRDDQQAGLTKGGSKPPPVRAPKPRPSFTPTSRAAQLRTRMLGGERQSTPKGPLPPGPKLNRFGGEIRAKSPAEFNPAERQAFTAYERAKALGKQPRFTEVEMQQMGLIPHLAPDYHFDAHGRPLGGGSIASNFVEDFIHTTLGAPMVPIDVGTALTKDVGAVSSGHPEQATHTYRNVLKPIGQSFKESVTHPGRHPLNTALNVGAVASLGAGALESAAGAEAGATAARLAGESAFKGAVKGARTRGAPIELKVPGENGKITTVRVTRSNNAAVRLAQRMRVARQNRDLAKETGGQGTVAGGLRSSFGSAEHHVGKALARANELEQQMLESHAHGLDKFHRKVGRLPLNASTLTDAEQKAIDIASTHGRGIVGNKTASMEAVQAHAVYHANAAKLAEAEQAHIAGLKQDLQAALDAGDEHAAKVAARRLKRAPQEYGLPENHVAQAALAKAAESHLVAPKGRLKAALERVPRAIDVREQLAGDLTNAKGEARLTDERALFRLGARHAELTYGAKGVETPLQELKRHLSDQATLERLRNGKTGAKVAQIQGLLDRIDKVRAKRGGPAHQAELGRLKAELDAFTTKYGPAVKVLGAKRVNDALQAAMPAERRFLGETAAGSATEHAVIPHTLDSAEKALEQMRQRHEAVLGRFAMGPDYVPGKPLREQFRLSPTELEEQRYRNYNNGVYAKTMKALNAGKRGPKGGSAALRRGVLANVKDQRLRQLERDMHEVLQRAADKGDAGAQRILEHSSSMTDLLNGISHVREHAAFGGEVTPELLAEHLGGRQLPVTRAKDMGATIEETRPRPDLSKAKITAAERGSARAAGKLDQFHVLDAQETLLKRELGKLTGANRKGGGSMKPGARMLDLLRSEEPRNARIGEIHDDLIASGKLLKDQGAFYLPSRELHDVRKVSSPAPRASEFGFSDPTHTAIASLDKHYTAGHERQGVNRTDATRLAQGAYREANKAATLDRGFKRLWGMSKPTREQAGGEGNAIAIRATPDIPEPLRRLINRVDFKGLSAEEAAGLPPAELEQLREYLFPKNVDANTNLTADGIPVRWLDRRMTQGLEKRQTRGAVIGHVKGKEVTGGDLFDLINQPIRAGLLYTKPAYALNFLQALGTITLQQGIYTPANLARAFRLGRDLGWEDQHRIFGLVGEGATHALIDDRAHWLGEAVQGAGHFWNAVVDRYPRVAAFLHEARRAGYTSGAELHNLLHDEGKRADLLEISDRANREAIDYSMSQWERQNLRRALFFYPWIRGATLWSLRFPLEHPLQSAMYAPLAEKGRGEVTKALGALPSYEEGLNVAGGKAFNLGNLNTFQTLLDTVQGLGALGSPGSPEADRLAGELGPVTGALETLVSGKTSLGHDLPQNTSRVGGAFGRLTEGQPLLVAEQRITGKQNRHTNVGRQPSNNVPHDLMGRIVDASERYAAGGLVPVHPNLPALHAKAETERVTQMGSRNALIYHYGKAYEQVDQEFKNVAKILPPGFDAHAYEVQIKSAIDTQRELALHLRDYSHEKGLAESELTGQQRLGVVLGVLEQAHAIDHSIVERELAAMKGLPDKYRDLVARKQAEALAHGAGGGAVLAGWKALLDHSVHVQYAGAK